MISKLVAYETGQLDDREVVALFQHLLDTGIIYVLQGHYARTAQGFLDEGLITRSPAKKVRRRIAKRGPKALAADKAKVEAARLAAAISGRASAVAAEEALWALKVARKAATVADDAARVAAEHDAAWERTMAAEDAEAVFGDHNLR